MTTWHRLTAKFPIAEDEACVPFIVSTKEIVEATIEACEEEVRTGRAAEGKTRLAAFEVKEVTKHWLDLGGIAWAHRKLFDLEIEGLKLTVPAKDVESYEEMLSPPSQRFRKLNDSCWVFMLPVHPVGLWLTGPLANQLHKQLVRTLPEALAIADVENQQHNEAMRSHPNLDRSVRSQRRVRKMEET